MSSHLSIPVKEKKLFHGIRPITPIYAKIKNAGLPGTNPVIQGLA
jgi:hypothetical protein